MHIQSHQSEVLLQLQHETQHNPPSFPGLPRYDLRGRLNFDDRVRSLGLGLGLCGGRSALGFRRILPRVPTHRRPVSVYDGMRRVPRHDAEEDVPRALVLEPGVERCKGRPGI